MSVFKNFSPLLILIMILLSLSIGYALYGKTIALNGRVELKKVGAVEIISARLVKDECKNLTSYNEPTYERLNINSRVLSSSTSFGAVYLIEIANNSLVDQTYTGLPINATIEGYDYVPVITTKVEDVATGALLEAGYTLKVGETISIKVSMDFKIDRNQGGVTVIVNGAFTSQQDNSGSILASFTPKEGSIKGNNLAPVNLSIINTFKYRRTLSLSSSNKNVAIVDKDGAPLSSISIDAESEKDYEIYLTHIDGAIFLYDTTETYIIVSSNMIEPVNAGKIVLDVDKTEESDTEKVQVGNVALSINELNAVEGEAILTWDRIDKGGTPVKSYYISLVEETTGQTHNFETGSGITNYKFSNLSAGTYHAQVYGIDEAGNSGLEDCQTASTSTGYCTVSESKALKWVYNVTYNLTRLSSNGATTALIYSTYETTLTVSANNYSRPSYVTITMGGETITAGTDYSYDSSSGKIIINKVTGDISISGSAALSTCVIKGTKVLLANGTYKNIENIDYDDLLTVYDHENGRTTYEYPVWIEKVQKANSYLKTTFSDGSTLGTVGPHGIFSVDDLNYVLTTDREHFDIGTEVVKVDSKGEVSTVKVVSLEEINEDVEYYHVSSTRYHNIITNDIMTTDGMVVTSYFYSFNDDYTWGQDRYDFLSKNDLFHYEDWTYAFPEHIFRGYRMEEAKNVYNKGYLNIEYFSNIFMGDRTKNLLTNESGITSWMVTTSEDFIDESNKHKYLVEDKSFYTVGEPENKNNFVGWLNTSDNKIYFPGDEIKVVYGIHLIAQYSD